MKLSRFSHINSTMLLVSVVIALLLVLDYSMAFPAPANPPSNNVAAPINVSASSQRKFGPLAVDGLVVNGTQQLISYAPTVRYNDSTAGHSDWWTRVDGNRFYFLLDRNNDGSWSGGAPWPLTLDSSGGTPEQDFALFSNQVRATEYCDRSGANCFVPVSIPTCANNQILVASGGNWVCGDDQNTEFEISPTVVLSNRHEVTAAFLQISAERGADWSEAMADAVHSSEQGRQWICAGLLPGSIVERYSNTQFGDPGNNSMFYWDLDSDEPGWVTYINVSQVNTILETLTCSAPN